MTTIHERPDPYGPRRRTIPLSVTAITSDVAVHNPTLLMAAGLRAMLHERPEQALECLNAVATPEALEAKDPVAIDALAYLSSVHWSLGDVDQAMESSDQALELGPDRFASNQKAGEMAMRLGDMGRSEELFLAAVRASEPGTADSRAAEASLREARRRVEKGIRHGASAPRLGGWISRIAPRRRRTQAPGEAITG